MLETKKQRQIASIFLSILIIFLGIIYFANRTPTHHAKEVPPPVVALSDFRNELSKSVDFHKGFWPKSLNVDSKHLQIEYYFNDELEGYIKKVLRRYFTDYSSVVVIDNNTGGILASVDYSFRGRQFSNALSFSTTHPSASIFKIVTAAALLAKKDVDEDTRYRCRGRGTTLYKYQLKEKKGRWDRFITLKNAFAYSNNVVFGRAARRDLNTGDLTKSASHFAFNKDYFADLKISPSIFYPPTDDYNLAEKSSGFNRDTTVSPVHGALLSSIVANEGIFRPVRVVKKVTYNGEVVTDSLLPEREKQVISKEVSEELQDLMKRVVTSGTARKNMYFLSKKFDKYLEFGGKTGRISGGIPDGTRDWFTVYAKPKNGGDKGISVCVMNVNGRKWYVKSSYIAKKILNYYYTQIVPVKKKLSKTLVQVKNNHKGDS